MRCLSLVVMQMVLGASLGMAAENPTSTAREELAALSKQMGVISRCFNLVHEVVAPSVVSIRTSEEILNPFVGRDTQVEIGEGSGFVVSTDDKFSYILTNAHVVLQTNNDQEFLKGANNKPVGYDHLAVQLNDNREVDADYVGVDLSTDLAVVKIPVPHLTAIEWGDSDKSRVGDMVLALGYPLGVGYSATSGIVSATDRSTGIYNSIHGLESFIQTDAAINPGNSGGPLVGIDGKIIGVNSNILSRTGVNIGIGFAIPSNLARRVAQDLIAYGHVRWTGIGVDLDELSADMAQDLKLPAVQAVRIVRVLAHSPAATAGLERNDIVLAVNQMRIHSLMNFRARMACCKIGEAMVLHLWRAGTELDLTVVPVDRDDVRKQDEHDVELKNFGLRVGVEDGPGLVVTAVEPNSVSGMAGFIPGDRLLQERSLHNLHTLEDAETMAKRREIIVQVLHEGRASWVRLRH